MEKKKSNLPARSEVNKEENDVRYKNQDEYDVTRKSQLKEDDEIQNEIRNTAKEEHYKDSQLKHERMIDPETKKQPEKWDRVDRKLPNLKK